MKSWFTNPPFQKLVITQFKSIDENVILGTRTISDANLINKLTHLIEQIPADGDKLKSFGGSTPWISLEFSNSKNSETLQFFNNRIKTPSTGFNTHLGQAEEDLYTEVIRLLGSNK